MSTRSWYEYYVLEEEKKEISLSMRYYKWGDAFPEEAIGEYAFFRKLLYKFSGKLPVHLLEEMLQDNLGPAYEYLHQSFSLGCYFFFLHRTKDYFSPFKRLCGTTPTEETSEYKLGYAVGLAQSRSSYAMKKYDDENIDMANFFIKTGKLLRRWPPLSLRWGFFKWIHYLTLFEDKVEMGAIAQDGPKPFDVSYLYRFLICVPKIKLGQEQEIRKIKLQLCTSGGKDLLPSLEKNITSTKDEDEKKYLKRDLESIQKSLEEEKVELFFLEEEKKTNTQILSHLFEKEPTILGEFIPGR
jgi:hypothetical protein